MDIEPLFDVDFVNIDLTVIVNIKNICYNLYTYRMLSQNIYFARGFYDIKMVQTGLYL